MSTEIILAAGVGGIIPSLLKLFHWATSAEAATAEFKLPRQWPILLLVVVLQVLFALVAAWLLAPQDKLSAAAFGYGAPDVLLRFFGSILADKDSAKKAPLGEPSRRQALSLWLRL
jgi:hypothetical protein